MKRGITWIALTCLIVSSLVLASCTTKTTTSTSTSTTATKTTTTTKTTANTSTTKQPTPTATTVSTTTSTGHWWDSLGKPQYGGTITMRLASDATAFDPYNVGGQVSIMRNWIETLFSDDWTTEPSTFNFKTMFCPIPYVQGLLAQSYEMPDPTTVIIHLRQGIHWQNIPPANGREFTADDVVYKFDRLLGLGNGYTQIAPLMSVLVFRSLQSVTATDKYTTVFKFGAVNVESILEALLNLNIPAIESPDVVKQYGDTSDWHHAIGTGPFILTDFVSGSSATLVKNPNYWGHDERYPQNQLPYVNGLTYLIIPDQATTMAGIRIGKIDLTDGLSLTDAQSLSKTNPEIVQVTYPPYAGEDIAPKNDVVPFNDIRVREALQKAIDLPTIAKSYYGGTVDPYPLTLTSSLLTGWGFPYAQWPQDLKDEYSYDPTAAKKLLADAGYPTGFKTNVVAQTIADLNLLQIVQSYFSAIGVTMEIRTMDAASWLAFVQSGHKQDQLAYKAIGHISDDYSPMDQLASFKTGGTTNIWNVSDPVIDAAINKAQAATSSVADIQQAIRDVNERIARQHVTISLLVPPQYGISQPWLKGYGGQYDSISGGMTAGGASGFFKARFWVDQNLKKSMGH